MTLRAPCLRAKRLPPDPFRSRERGRSNEIEIAASESEGRLIKVLRELNLVPTELALRPQTPETRALLISRAAPISPLFRGSSRSCFWPTPLIVGIVKPDSPAAILKEGRKLPPPAPGSRTIPADLAPTLPKEIARLSEKIISAYVRL